MERYYPIEYFGFARDVIGLTRRLNIVNKSDLIFLQRIMTPSFFYLDMFALVVPYLFDFCFVHKNEDLPD